MMKATSECQHSGADSKTVVFDVHRLVTPISKAQSVGLCCSCLETPVLKPFPFLSLSFHSLVNGFAPAVYLWKLPADHHALAWVPTLARHSLAPSAGVKLSTCFQLERKWRQRASKMLVTLSSISFLLLPSSAPLTVVRVKGSASTTDILSLIDYVTLLIPTYILHSSL